MSPEMHLGQIPMQLVERAWDQALLLNALVDLIEQVMQILHSVAAGEEDHQLGRPARLAVLAQQRCQHHQPLLAGHLQPQLPGSAVCCQHHVVLLETRWQSRCCTAATAEDVI